MTTHARFNLNVVSPQFPCGAAWLANAFIELGVPLWDLWGFDTRAEWCREDDGRYRYVAAHTPWQQTLSSLRLGAAYDFDPALQPRFSHGFPWQCELDHPTVLIIRDPRDALYSEWQRQLRNRQLAADTSFGTFLKHPFFEGPISNLDLLWLHLHSWQVILQEPTQHVAILRFEDWKAAPEQMLQETCSWIGLQASTEALQRAAQASDVRHLQQVEQRLLQEDPQARQFNRRGQAYEWRSTWESDWFQALGDHWQPLLDGLGYEPGLVAGRWTRCFDLDEVLHWRGLTDTASRIRWARRLGL